MRIIPRNGAWYSDSTLEGDDVNLYGDSHIEVNLFDGSKKRIELPFTNNNILQLTCYRWKNEVLIAGMGHRDDCAWLFKNNKWTNLGKTCNTYTCAFGDGNLYYVVGLNQYRILDLETETSGPIINREIGSNGIRYISFPQSSDGIVTGDSTYGPAPYELSEFTSLQDTILGQSWKNDRDDLIGLVLGDTYHKLYDGRCKFVRFKRLGKNLAITTVNESKKESVHFWMTVDELISFPRFNPFSGEVVKPKSPIETREPGPIVNKEEKMPVAKNEIEVVRRMIRLHPEVNTMDDDDRAKILDYTIKALGGKPWGRKARNKDGSNKNTDVLAYLLSDGRFELYDVISGGDGSATWDYAGTFSAGENGYWAEGNPVVNGKLPEDDKKEPVKDPEPIVIIKEVVKEVIKPRVTYEEMMHFVDKIDDTFDNTKLGKTMNAFPEHTVAHILWRYFFEHDNFSDVKLLEEVRLRGNEEWRD